MSASRYSAAEVLPGATALGAGRPRSDVLRLCAMLFKLRIGFAKLGLLLAGLFSLHAMP